MKIVVCGDSFASADRFKPGTHFSELLESNGHAVTNLARGGISNVGIAFQLQTAVELNPDAVVFTTTGHDRIEMLLNKQKFIPGLGLKNFIYPYQSDLSTGSKYVGNVKSAILSDIIQSFVEPRLDQPNELASESRAEIVKQYLVHFHDTKFKKIQNDWIIGYWKYRMKEQGIPFVHLYRNGPVGRQMYDYVDRNPQLIDQAVYHTDTETQHNLAQELNILLKEIAK